MDEISVVSGLQSLWETDAPLALLVTFLAIFAPYAKVIGLALIQWNLASPRLLPVLGLLGKLAMADVFLVALYIVLAKGIGHATVETAWGFTCSRAVSWPPYCCPPDKSNADPASPLPPRPNHRIKTHGQIHHQFRLHHLRHRASQMDGKMRGLRGLEHAG